jgi:CRISPR-associated protein Csm4
MQIESWSIQGNGFHFGRHGLGQEETGVTLSSDSLFAALVARLAALDGAQAVEGFISPFLSGEPPFVISSTFPFAGQVRFFPVPVYSMRQESTAVRSKDIKRIKYLSENNFRKLIDGESMAEIFNTGMMVQNNQVLVSQEESATLPSEIRAGGMPVWAIEQRPRVTLGRSTQAPTIFFTGRVSFGVSCGLWFGIRWMKDDPALKAKIADLLVELGDSGLGGERSAGFGACKITPSSILELPDANGKFWVCLSRYLPKENEMAALQDPVAAYNLTTIGGWSDSPVKRGQRRRAVNFLAEGSVFGKLEHPVPGQVVDVRPRYKADPDPLGHSVYRSGLALSVGMKGGEV